MNSKDESQYSRELESSLVDNHNKSENEMLYKLLSEWLNHQIELKHKNIIWKSILSSWILHSFVPIIIFLLGLLYGIFSTIDPQ